MWMAPNTKWLDELILGEMLFNVVWALSMIIINLIVQKFEFFDATLAENKAKWKYTYLEGFSLFGSRVSNLKKF